MSAKIRTPCADRGRSPACATSASSSRHREPATQRVAGTADVPCGSASSSPASVSRPAATRAMTAATRLAARTLAMPPGRSTAAIWAERVGRVVDDFEDAVTHDGVDSFRAEQLDHAGRRRPGCRAPVAAVPVSAARRSSAASASGLGSITVTEYPSSASGTANPPVPPPMSSTSTTSTRRGKLSERLAQHVPDHGGATAVRASGPAAWLSLGVGRRRTVRTPRRQREQAQRGLDQRDGTHPRPASGRRPPAS